MAINCQVITRFNFISDIPMILSGEVFGILEPREEIFTDIDGRRVTGQKYSLSTLAKFRDQFQPFREIGQQLTGDQSFAENGHFNGTLFRFPLRNAPSSMSSTIYNEAKVLDLFKNFENEAKEIVLFLNHVQLVSLISDQKEILTVASEFTSDAGSRSKGDFMKKRLKHFALKEENDNKKLSICANEPLSASWGFKITVQAPGQLVSQEEWVVTSKISGIKNMTTDLTELASKICLLPHITLATRISSHTDEFRLATKNYLAAVFFRKKIKYDFGVFSLLHFRNHSSYCIVTVGRLSKLQTRS